MEVKKLFAGLILLGMCGGVYALEDAIVIDSALSNVKGMKAQLLSDDIAGVSLKNVRIVGNKTYFEFDVPESNKAYKQWLSELHGTSGCKIKFINPITHRSKVLTLHITSSTTTRTAGKIAMLGVVPTSPLHATYQWA